MNMRTSLLSVAALLCLVTAGCLPPADANSNSDADSRPSAHGANVNTPTPTPAGASVRVTYPDDGGAVEQGEVVRGTSRNVPAGQKIWVVIYIPRVGRYYPQNNPAAVQPDGSWSSPTTFGGPGSKDKGLKFEVQALTADGAAQAAFQSYLRGARDKSDYPGMEQPPEGATLQHSVTVTRK